MSASLRSTAASAADTAAYSRRNPFPAPVLANINLNGAGSSKDTRHIEFSLEGSGLAYEPGDALGILPRSNPELARAIVARLGLAGSESVPSIHGGEIALVDALTDELEIAKLHKAMLKPFVDQTGDGNLRRLYESGSPVELHDYFHGRDLLDLLEDHPSVRFSPVELVGVLRKLAPRLYSIASSLRAHPGQVHLLVAVLRYESRGRARHGTCSTYLADRVPVGGTVPAFVHVSKGFRLPADPATPVIMIGPGTGLAPFRAFLEERQVLGSSGRNWLFFGDQHAATDFLYRDQLTAMHRDGLLTRLSTAFSRDQREKIYVQNRMIEDAVEMFDWLEAGAHFYVCGDASRMAKDVDHALHEVVRIGGGLSSEQAVEYVKALEASKRYHRDVY